MLKLNQGHTFVVKGRQRGGHKIFWEGGVAKYLGSGWPKNWRWDDIKCSRINKEKD